MRRWIMAAAMLSFVLPLWALPAYAQEPGGITVATRCCQMGVTKEAASYDDLPSCYEVPITEFNGCKGGNYVSGTCQTDGACSGSTVCCQGAHVGEACVQAEEGGPWTAPAHSCAYATESNCDTKLGVGHQTSQSVPGGTCEEYLDTGTYFCNVPAEVIK